MMSSSPSPGPGRAAAAAGRCSACGSRLRPDDAWCSLCHTAVQTGHVPDVGDMADETHAVPDHERRVTHTAVARPRDVARRDNPGPDVGRPDNSGPEMAGPDVARPDVVATADRMLAGLAAAESARNQASSSGSLEAALTRLSRRGGGLLLAGVGAAVLLALLFLGFTVLGLLL
jgi:hypothetical protein